MIAIDFGTTRTKLAFYDPIKRRVSLASLGSGDQVAFPSLFYVGPDGQVFCGSEALDFLDSDPAGTVRRVKSRLRDRAIRVNGHSLAPVDLVARLFRSLRLRVAEEIPTFDGKPPTSVVLTLPAAGAGSGPVVERIMREAAAAAGFTNVELLTEPEGAAMAWQHEEGAGGDDVVVILDGGGGTVDWACLKRVGGVLRLFPDCPPGGDDKVGGEYLDEDLFGILLSNLEARNAGEALDTVQRQSNKWFARVRGLRERFNRTGKVGSQDAMRVLGEVVSLDDDEVRGAIQDRFVSQVCAGFGKYLDGVRRATGVASPRVLLVGGTGQVSGLKEALKERCACDPTWWQLSEFAPAIGATWWGVERSSGLDGTLAIGPSATAEPARPQSDKTAAVEALGAPAEQMPVPAPEASPQAAPMPAAPPVVQSAAVVPATAPMPQASAPLPSRLPPGERSINAKGAERAQPLPPTGIRDDQQPPRAGLPSWTIGLILAGGLVLTAICVGVLGSLGALDRYIGKDMDDMAGTVGAAGSASETQPPEAPPATERGAATPQPLPSTTPGTTVEPPASDVPLLPPELAGVTAVAASPSPARPAVATPTGGRVTVAGEGHVKLLQGARTIALPASGVPAGSYEIWVSFDAKEGEYVDAVPSFMAGSASLREGQALVITCSRNLGACSAK